MSGGHDHSHGETSGGDVGALRIALGLIVAFMVVEVIVAFAAQSLALLADAGHMLTDATAFAAALWAITLAARPASMTFSFGLKRAEILSAAVNGVTLVAVSGVVLVQAIQRFLHLANVAGPRCWSSPWSGWRSMSRRRGCCRGRTGRV